MGIEHILVFMLHVMIIWVLSKPKKIEKWDFQFAT